MALSKIKLANKKAKREMKRKQHNFALRKQVEIKNKRNKRIRTMMIEGRKQDLEARRKSTDYVNQLESELVNG